MSKWFWMFVGIVTTLLIMGVIYLFEVYLKMVINRKKIKNILIQIKGQIDIKHNLLKEYLEINRDIIDAEVYAVCVNKLSSYNYKNESSIDVLKEFNEYYNLHLRNFDDDLLRKQCDESDKKINYIKDYYNELVNGFNNYKASGINSFLAKVVSIKDEKLY